MQSVICSNFIANYGKEKYTIIINIIKIFNKLLTKLTNLKEK